MSAISVLHLEDDVLDAELVHATLEAAGYLAHVTRVDTEETYRGALRARRYDVILADYSLPSFDGLSALNLLRELEHETPFIFLSGALGEELAIESLKRGATDYVLKHRLERLAPAIDRALREAAERMELRRVEQDKERLMRELAVAYEREHRIAETLQRSFLNTLEPGRFPNLDLATIYQAAWDEAQVGGDYYDYFALQNGRVAIVVGDVSGKGLIAAERTSELKYAFRAFLREHGDPAIAVTCLNEFLCEGSALDESGPEYFVVLTVAVVDPVSGVAEVVIGGAEPVLIIRANGIDEAKASGLPLGILTAAPYETVNVELNAGDVLMMYTDGLTEARRASELLGLHGVSDIARQCCSGSVTLDEMGECILESTREYAGGTLQDDACLLLARIKL